ncbi:MAG TPA: alpha/beta hydrolase [Casimicrobiaceae bacterium]|nr:alpha/beta hydrolase [Casimicrobiaceae bacterium]
MSHPVPARTRLAPGSFIGALALALACASCADTAGRHGRVALSECRLPHLAQAAQCGTIRVPENRAQPGGRQIELFAAILPANTLSPQPDPLVILAGGPGQAASTLAGFAQSLGAVRRTRDIVLIDQRGTGRSAALSCKAFTADDRAEFELDPVPKARACLEELKSRGADPAQYTTTRWVEDLEAVRDALGYPRLNLWGGSYGTRVALEYLRRHPERVRTVVLDGVAPPALRITLDVWRTRDAALDDIIAACRASPACSHAFPDPAATLEGIERDLGDGKEVTFEDPRVGAPQTFRFTFEHVIGALQPLTYAPELASLVPELLQRASEGDYAPLVAATLAVTADLPEQMNAALHYSVTCAEDVPRIDATTRTKVLLDSRAGRMAERIIAVCDLWPRGDMPADFATPVTSNVPVLLLSGGLDPVTPPAYGAEVARTLTHSRHIVAPGYGHIVSPHACAPRLVSTFVERGDFDTLSEACIAKLGQSKRPPFFTDRLAARP